MTEMPVPGPEMPCTDDERPFCADSCGRPATDERLAGLTAAGDEVVELVCVDHARHPAPEESA